MTSPRLLASHLHTAAELYRDIESSQLPADRQLGNFFHKNRKQFGSKDRKTVSEAVYALFRHKSFIEAWIAGNSKNAALLRMAGALAREKLLDREAFAEIAGAKNAELYDSLAGGRFPSHLQNLPEPEALALEYSFPLWLVERWRARLGRDEAARLIGAMNERPPLVLRVNPVKTSREALIARLMRQGHDAVPGGLSPWSVKVADRFNVFEMEEFQDGHFEVQDEGSQMVALALEPRPGETVWDACAGGGGKTLFLAALMQNKGRVVATDVRARKLEDVRKRAKRAGLFNIFPADLGRLGESKIFRQGVDKLLIDAPCSGSGTLRRNPDAKWKITPERLALCRRDQLRILESYVSHLKPGGRLVYATCSMEPEEDESVIDEFLEHNSRFSRSVPDVHLYPHRHGTDGFFISTLSKAIHI